MSKRSNRTTTPVPRNTFIEAHMCQTCGKFKAKATCSSRACLKCCIDENCEGHSSLRKSLQSKETLLNSETPDNKLATYLREEKLKKGKFAEPAFMYHNDVVRIWDLGAFVKRFPAEIERKRRTSVLKPGVKRKKKASFDSGLFRMKMEKLLSDKKM